MPEIVVKSRAANDAVIAVQIDVADFESERFRARLLERLSRAVGHADAAEQAFVATAAGSCGGATQLKSATEAVTRMLSHGMALAEIEGLIERQPSRVSRFIHSPAAAHACWTSAICEGLGAHP